MEENLISNNKVARIGAIAGYLTIFVVVWRIAIFIGYVLKDGVAFSRAIN